MKTSERAIRKGKNRRPHYTIGDYYPEEGTMRRCLDFNGPIKPQDIQGLIRLHGFGDNAKVMVVIGRIDIGPRSYYYGKLKARDATMLVQTDIDLGSDDWKLIEADIRRRHPAVGDIYPLVVHYRDKSEIGQEPGE